MTAHAWDMLQLTLSTDIKGGGFVRVMYDRDEISIGYNLLRERRLNRDAIDLPEVIVLKCSALELGLAVYYGGGKERSQECVLHLNENPEFEIKIGSSKKIATLGFRLVDFDSSDCDDVYDVDGRYDAWA